MTVSYFIIGEIIIIKKIVLTCLILVLGCFKPLSIDSNNSFNPIQSLDYSLYELDDGKLGLTIYYEINGRQFFYKKEDDKYLASLQVVFQIVNKDNLKEVDRKVVDLKLDKNIFDNSEKRVFYSDKVDLILDKNLYSVNIDLLDLNSKRNWIKKISINNSEYKTLSQLEIYYFEDNQKKHIYENIGFYGKEFQCDFDYIKQKDINRGLNLYLFNKNDTLHHQDIPLLSDQNSYNINVKLPENIEGMINCCVTDGKQKRVKRIFVRSTDKKDFWENDSNVIKNIMRYVLPVNIYKDIKKMDDSDMIVYLRKYWDSLDPDESTDINELLDELNLRFKYVNLEFKELRTEGWETDRGRVYIVNGKPKSINYENNTQMNIKREIWTYDSKKVFIFEDKNSFGRYYLVNGIF